MLIHIKFIYHMRKNLIFLGELDSCRLAWNSRHDVLDIKSSNKKVILSIYKHNNVYLLKVIIICEEINFIKSRVSCMAFWTISYE